LFCFALLQAMHQIGSMLMQLEGGSSDTKAQLQSYVLKGLQVRSCYAQYINRPEQH